MFEIQPINAEQYRAKTRRSSLVVIVLFAATAMLVSGLLVALFGESSQSNFSLNLTGVITGLVITALTVRYYLAKQPFMHEAVYGWQLKRSLMRITNLMHKVKDKVAVNDPVAMQVLRFYHLGVMQMYLLDANTSALSQMTREIDEHVEKMQAQGLNIEQNRLDQALLDALNGK